jgi:hypothetical protein
VYRQDASLSDEALMEKFEKYKQGEDDACECVLAIHFAE